MTARIERGGAAAIYGTTALGATLPPRRVPTKVSIPPYSGVWGGVEQGPKRGMKSSPCRPRGKTALAAVNGPSLGHRATTPKRRKPSFHHSDCAAGGDAW